MVNLQEIAVLGTSAVPGDSPTGISARYEPEYEQLQAEIEKLQSVSQSPILWDKVVSLATSLLSGKSKDMLVASYLSAGLLSEQGYAGLTTGLTIFRDLLATYWEQLYPPLEKMRGRESAVRWLDERGAAMVAAMPEPSEGDREALTACAAAIDAFKALLAEKFLDSPLSIPDLAEKIEAKLGSVPEPPPPPPEPTSTEQAAPSSDGSSPAPQEEASTPPPAPAEIDSPERAREEIQKAVDYLRRTNAADPLACTLERILLWSPLAELPEPMPSGAEPSLLPEWEKALKKREFARVLEEAQGRLSAAPLWLDPNLYAVRAMEGLGAEYDAARAAITGQVGALVVRMPGLMDASFEGDVPAASDVTKQWIRSEALAGAATPAGGEGADRVEGLMQEARKLATRGKLPAATALVQKELASSASGRTRFLWRLHLAKLCAESGRPNLAVPQLEALDAESEKGALDQWEPELAVEVVKLLWQCYSSLSKSGAEGMSEKASRAYSRLCRLDLSTAMALDGKK